MLVACPQDLARLGLLYLRCVLNSPPPPFFFPSHARGCSPCIPRDGKWESKRILPEGWVDHARTCSYTDGELRAYGAHWWVDPPNPSWFYACGYDGQRLLLVPEKDLLIVRLGRGGNIDGFRRVWETQLKALVGYVQ